MKVSHPVFVVATSNIDRLLHVELFHWQTRQQLCARGSLDTNPDLKGRKIVALATGYAAVRRSADSELGLTTIRPSSQSTPEPPGA